MLIIGLTGGIGSGKSAASDWFAKQGITIVDADVIAHQVVKAGSPTLAKIVAKFGDWVLDHAGEMNRRAVREYVFGHPQALMDLEQITHPAIREAAEEALNHATSPYVILVAPLLLEGADTSKQSGAGLANLCDRILVVDSTEEFQLQRASKRDGQSRERILAIMANQLPRHERMVKANDVVNNNGTLDELYAQLEPLHEEYLALSRVN